MFISPDHSPHPWVAFTTIHPPLFALSSTTARVRAPIYWCGSIIVYLAHCYGRTRYLRCCHPRTVTVNYVLQRTQPSPGCIVPEPRDDSRCTTVLSHHRCKPRGIIKQPAYGGVISRKLSARGHAARAKGWNMVDVKSVLRALLYSARRRKFPEMGGLETKRRGIDFVCVFHSDKLSVSTSLRSYQLDQVADNVGK